jgi:hypothetical protein
MVLILRQVVRIVWTVTVQVMEGRGKKRMGMAVPATLRSHGRYPNFFSLVYSQMND